MGTYRERRLAKAERLRGWAGSREQAAIPVQQERERYAGDHAFNFQPGHIPERARLIKREDRMFASLDKADEMRGRADEIERQAGAAIYDDDPDAIDRLAAKLAALEAERDRIKAYNASCRKAAKTGGTGDTSLLSEKTRESLEGRARIGFLGPGGALATTNLTGNIGRTRERLERLKRRREHGPADRIITARFASECAACGAGLERGDTIRYNRQDGARCVTCQEGG